MDAVIDLQAAAEEPEPEPGSAEIIDLDAYRRARGLAPARAPAEETDPFPWAYTFGPTQRGG
ncbi:hypothetical protein [Phenylobacterium sp.]|jgi:hypothetical protein|uniref:hypothetical protein n=1 Tax=Phenylobacterium sp. TaxID=1871053 RepID=UPI002E37C018|nr:hypothetical protein [Phenylobacterium sp.]HEX2562184.1 hypothetical protein [Phenylobacterium sp.]